ncbi:MAG TPA: hypothetical protein VHK47_17465 [Polyangia bacterium]|jgi:hypothetical protein|nr:hypothetical protein [Polyangia bacterium]
MRRLIAIAALGQALALPLACTTSPDPPVSFVTGLRVLAISAEPPQVSPGQTTQVTALVIDTTGRPVDVTWSRCLLAPLPGEAVNVDCATAAAGAPALEPIGSGLSVSFAMPDVAATALGLPDATNGVYVPLMANITDGADTIVAAYRLRLGDGTPPNMNPQIASVDVVDAGGGLTPIDPATPLGVHAGDSLTLEAVPAAGSAQAYTGPDDMPATEVLTISWFTTAGTLSVAKTSDMQPTTVLKLQESLPGTGENIDLFAVVHDGRGGVGYTHRVLELQ